jgi:hypothetical protein
MVTGDSTEGGRDLEIYEYLWMGLRMNRYGLVKEALGLLAVVIIQG